MGNPNVSEEEMAAELRRRGYTVTPPGVVPILYAMLREALGLPPEEERSDG